MPSEVKFIPLSPAHRDLLVNWTAQPHVKQWWSEADEDVDSFLEHSDEHWPFIGHVDDSPIAYIQSWRPSQNPNYPWQNNMSPSTRGIDLFIGPPDKLGNGYGPLIVAEFSKKLFNEGATRIVIDPDFRNERAIRAYTKVGFVRFDKTDDSLLMELYPQ
jgi:aminoglycoside 6'-N-acetyltransferase